MKMKYNLVGIDGNAFNVMEYVATAMKECKYSKAVIDEYRKNATSGDYNNLLAVSVEMIDKCNHNVPEIFIEVPLNYKPKYWNEKGDYQNEWAELTDQLVPATGAGNTVNAELVRGANRFYYDLFNNGNENVIEVERIEVEYEDENGDYYIEYEDGTSVMNNYYMKFFDLMDECGIIDDVEGFREAVMTTNDSSPLNSYRYDTLINKVYEYVTTHKDKELPAWYEKN